MISKKTFSAKYLTFAAIVFTLTFSFLGKSLSQENIKIMSYNVLKYGDGCQGPNGLYHSYLKTIIGYASPDIAGLVKVASIPQTRGAKGKAPFGFADSIL